MTEILNIKELSTGYQSASQRKIISKELNLSIKSGSFIALLGPNGCGKSTLLRTIAGLQKSMKGDININGINIQQLKSKEKARMLSLVLTDKIKSAYLIVEDIVAMGRYPHIGSMGVLSDFDHEVVRQSMDKCSLQNFKQRAYSELSDGEKQRVMLARALAQDTPLMMLDEPTAHLDLPNRISLMKMLRDLAQETNKAILLSTHELDLALQWCDGLWLMNKNGEVSNGTPEDLVLNGSFYDIFSNNAFYFDIETGTFKIKIKSKGNVYISGDNIIKEWTKRAIERVGYTETKNAENADIIIQIDDNKHWQVEHNNQIVKCQTIEEVLSSVNNLTKK